MLPSQLLTSPYSPAIVSVHFLFCLPLLINSVCLLSCPFFCFSSSILLLLSFFSLSLLSWLSSVCCVCSIYYFSLYPGLFQMPLTVSSLVLTIKYFHLSMLGVVMISVCTHMSLGFDRKQRQVSVRTRGFSQHFSPTSCQKPFLSRVCAFLPFRQLLILLDVMLSWSSAPLSISYCFSLTPAPFHGLFQSGPFQMSELYFTSHFLHHTWEYWGPCSHLGLKLSSTSLFFFLILC